MATNADAWVAEEVGGASIQKFAESALNKVSRKEPMAGEVKRVPVAGNFAISAKDKHAALDETTSTEAVVELIARRIGGFAKIAAEDVNDTTNDVLAQKRSDAAVSLAKYLDNAAFSVTAARTGDGEVVPFTSVYRAVSQYNGASNLIQTAGALTFDDLNNAVAFAEGSDFNDGELVIVAHRSFGGLVRGIKDSNGDPILNQLILNGTSVQTLFGIPLVLSNGLKTSATATASPTGNALMVVGPRNLLIEGVATLPGLGSGVPGYQVQAPANGLGFITDQYFMKAEVRRGFAVGDASSFGVIEKTA